ncbi:hypothetical protein SAMD00023353_6700060 [Rosellinia necatrix]|uniref:Uncharacterized protein n=1 Tax=Rosellinia necatrix TaxID=77044 RepID=A0A1W2TTH0_ROSNE|nr:hypothetical protein SAMD00023353_6700060 [Rosellinia necatrix]
MRRTISRLARPGPPKPRAKAPPRAKPDSQASVDDITPGQHVISVCKQHNIVFPFQLRPLKPIRLGNNPYRIGVVYSQKHSFAQKSMKYFDKAEHPFAKSLLNIYIEKKKEPLWIACNVHGAGSFPNKTATKKLAHALRDALAIAGYDRFGRRVLADGESSTIAELYGSLSVYSTEPLLMCNAKFTDLLECGKQIIASAEINLARDKDGCNLQKAQGEQYPSNRGDRQSQGPRHKSLNLGRSN